MGDEEGGRGAVMGGARAWAFLGFVMAVSVGAFLVSASLWTGKASDRTEHQNTRQKWGAEADALDLILRERQEPQGGITCYRRAGRYECPLHLAGQPTRWAACRLRREDERSDDGGRCAWIVGDP